MTIKKLKSIDIINVLSDLVSKKLETTVKLPTSQVFKKKIFAELKDFIEGRLIKNKEYFSSDNVFTTIYDFVKNIVDYLFENSL